MASFATSYIPTTASTATRAADTCSLGGSNFSSWYRQDEGTLYGDGIFSNTTQNNFLACVDDATSNNRWGIWKASASAQVNFTLSGVSASQSLGAVASQAITKVSASALTGFIGGSVNGSTVLSRTDNTSMPTVTQFNVGRRASGGGDYMNGHIRRLTYWPIRLGNNVLQAITQ